MSTTYHYQSAQGLYEDVVIPQTAINPSGPDGSMTVDSVDILGGLVASASGTPSCFALFQLPHSYTVGTSVYLHIHWVKNDGGDDAGTVIWEAKWRKSPINAVMGSYTAYEAGTLAVDPGDVRYHHGITTWTISSTDLNISTIIAVALRRNGGTSGSATIIGMDIHIQKKYHGSISELSLA